MISFDRRMVVCVRNRADIQFGLHRALGLYDRHDLSGPLTRTADHRTACPATGLIDCRVQFALGEAHVNPRTRARLRRVGQDGAGMRHDRVTPLQNQQRAEL